MTTTTTTTDGTYTLAYKDGSHFTFKIETVTKGQLVGKRIISYLAGSDNTHDFYGFAFLNDGNVCVWKKFRGGKLDERARHLEILFNMPERLEAAGLEYAVRSGRCRRCNRKLTVPASIHRGYGPDCAEMIGL